jgi:hypothetical protein
VYLLWPEKYRGIYVKHYGPIPKDELGRKYDIHHVDGNHSNNEPNNLRAVTLQEHYDIHYSQGDYAACLRLSGRIALTEEDRSELAILSSNKRVAEGRHNLTKRADGSSQSSDRVKAGTHHLLGGDIQRREVAAGRHHLLGGDIQRKSNAKRIAEGTHNFVGPALNKQRVEDGTHQWLKPEFKEKCRTRML